MVSSVRLNSRQISFAFDNRAPGFVMEECFTIGEEELQVMYLWSIDVG
jgi:hypothetical protein